MASPRLEFEPTGWVFADEYALATLNKLAALGVHLSLDDSGIGCSSLGDPRTARAVHHDRSLLH